LADKDLLELSLENAAAAIARRKLSAREYVSAFVAQSEACRDLGAYVSFDPETLMREAAALGARDGALIGVPLAIKDNINTKRLPTTAATGALKGFVAGADAPAIAPLFAAGALLGAKCNMHELAFGITTNNAVTGAARNPYDKDLIPGGSSGGVAAAIAARMMPAGIGTDTGGSVRLPAALCGIVGFRPTVGRYPGAGIVPISSTRDTAGPMTRSVADAILLDRLISGDATPSPSVQAKGLRIGLPQSYFADPLDADVRSAFDDAVAALTRAGVIFVREDLADVGALNGAISFPVALYEFMRDLPNYLAKYCPTVTMEDIRIGAGSPDVRGLVDALLGAGAIPEAVYRQAIDVERPKLRKLYADYFAIHAVDAILFPTSPLLARPIGDDETVAFNGERAPTFATFIRNTDPGSNAAIPGISLPIALSASGLPIGTELDGPDGSDVRLLAVARAIEDVLAFNSRPPVV
jgi:indoleacetamide hydrolase